MATVYKLERSIGYVDNEIIEMTADLVGCEVFNYSDGSKQFTRVVLGKRIAQSPRLSEDELTIFCVAHFDKYQIHYDKYCDFLIEGESEAMPVLPKFWH
ncbi:hypothetical protein VITU102760_24990 [Vibrio tubiashii]|uniref:Uncharacterized protein n=1 Tax=Vibrio tubiashii ATCC 19109 TaxID=1051646 RepID=F9T6P3_9VIBR|nr:hypothetical protein [Vibrio tubiashii]AIW17519.1 hypothetical protein IX91_26030 [Vibrio tubiashii ATCC 19109]EGU54448.1 hypothetical protein VITU9109_02702 [Vibrio tubiashii ATCC 19109]EIF01290.1 hypothetical protein VT1337_24430 [Vibrio tubiashii NCIMB 1337 = ATCC 19106]